MTESRRPRPVVQLTLMRLREMMREPGALFWTFGFPVLLSVALGIAFRVKGPEPVVVGALPGVSAAAQDALAKGGVQVRPLDEAAAKAALRSGQVAVVLVPPERPGEPLTYRFDAARPEDRLARATVDVLLQKAAGRQDPLAVRDREVSEPGSRYIDFLIPGLLAMNLMSGSMWGIGWVIVEMRVRKLLKRLLAAPMRRRHLLFAFGLSRLVVIPFEIAVILIFARVVFGVQVAGSYAALGLVCLAGAASFAAIAILVSSRAQNMQTVSGLMNLVMLPMFVLSGVFFSSAHFPEFARPFISALPLTAMCDGMRAVTIDGAGLLGTLPYLAVLAAWGTVSFVLGLRWFRWG
ncbi:MAG TPA: ABC transporter permease [Polyangia bacterium]|nr:ABC transporter permease [Polyangia bacterium]